VEDTGQAGGLEVLNPALGVLFVRDHDREGSRELAGEGGEEEGRQCADAARDDDTSAARGSATSAP